MSDRTKRILQIIIFVVIIVAMGFGIYLFFFKPLIAPPVAPPAAPPTAPPTAGLPPAAPAAPLVPVAPFPAAPAPEISPTATGGLTQISTLSTSPTLAPFISADGTAVQYYNRVDGKFYRVRPDGTLELLSDKVFFNVANVTWAPDSNQAILEYPDGSNIMYNFATGRQVTLPRHWQSFDFSPRSDGIAFLSVGIDEDARWLAVAQPDGSGTKAIEPLGDNASKVQVAWSPNDHIVAFSKTGSAQGFGNQEILMVGQQGENFRSLVVNGIGFQGEWSPDGTHILYSASSADNDWIPELWVVEGTPDRIGVNKTRLELNTWVDKCTFASATAIYCAVPETLERGIGLYPAAVGNTPDRLWRVDLASGNRDLIAIPPESHTIDNIVVSQDEQYLYFSDKISGQLYKINLR